MGWRSKCLEADFPHPLPQLTTYELLCDGQEDTPLLSTPFLSVCTLLQHPPHTYPLPTPKLSVGGGMAARAGVLALGPTQSLEGTRNLRSEDPASVWWVGEVFSFSSPPPSFLGNAKGRLGLEW